MKKNSLIFLKEQCRGSMRYFLMAMVFITLGSFFNFLSPKLIGVTVDSIIGEDPFELPQLVVDFIECLGGREYFRENISVIVLVFLGIILLNAGCEHLRLKGAKHLSEGIGYRMRQSIFERLQGGYFGYFKNVQTGDIMQRCSKDIDQVTSFAVEATDLLRVISKLIIAYWFMFSISGVLALVSFVTVPLISIYSVVTYGFIQKKFLLADEAEGRLQSRVQENLSAPRVVRAFGKQKYERDEFAKINETYSGLWIKVGNFLAWYESSCELFPILQTLLVLLVGTVLAVNGQISAGDIISFSVYNGMLSWPIVSIGRIVSNMGKASVALERVNEIYEIDNEDDEAGISFSFKGDIAFEHVYFEFDDVPVLEDLSFTIGHGETVALLGSSGSGKSVILALLARFYEPKSGRITIDGVDIQEINLSSLRNQLGVVLQEPFLFSRTIAENIAIATKEIDMDKVKQVSKVACIHNAVMEFTQGYDTVIGEKGVTISGGQKQRVAIARTLYTGAKILCFDDSLSAVDAITDSNIRTQLKHHTDQITTFIISQRVNTLMQSDKILVLDEGRIVEQGTHEELAMQGGIYASIVRIQQEIIEKTKLEKDGYGDARN
ncbi:MAG: ABC transporter ATP-binding protein [Eubacteriales bacterium]